MTPHSEYVQVDSGSDDERKLPRPVRNWVAPWPADHSRPKTPVVIYTPSQGKFTVRPGRTVLGKDIYNTTTADEFLSALIYKIRAHIYGNHAGIGEANIQKLFSLLDVCPDLIAYLKDEE